VQIQAANTQRCLPALTSLLAQATFKLSDGLSWADFKVLSVWCEDFNADFGHVELKQGGWMGRKYLLLASSAAGTSWSQDQSST
jgi:hypothetical protein